MDYTQQLEKMLAQFPDPRDKAKYCQSERRYHNFNWPLPKDEIVGHMDRKEYISRSVMR